eukprot:PhM_4_TR9412/c0_g1_i1/m.79084
MDPQQLRTMTTKTKKEDDGDDAWFNPPLPEQVATSQFCDETQQRAVKYIVMKAKASSEAALPSLLKRVKQLGYTEEQLHRCLRYIRDDAPIIVHVKLDQNERLEKMVKDTHYRNQFETKCSNGSYDSTHAQRIQWENRLFNRIYHDAAPFQRPKYGVLNIVRDPAGISSARFYGDSYFVLRLVRLRCSFTDQDSSSAAVSISSCEYYCHVLEKYTDSELKAVMDVGNGVVSEMCSSCISNYKEVQLHGELPFNRVVEKVMVNSRHKQSVEMTDMLETFCAKNNCSYEYI